MATEQLTPGPDYVPPCIDIESQPRAIGQRCLDCIVVDCKSLRVGTYLLEKEQENDELAQQNRSLQRQQTENKQTIDILNGELDIKEEVITVLEGRIRKLSIDSLVRSSFTPEGFQDHLMEDNIELRAELVHQRQWGLIKVDVRFLSVLNDLAEEYGDQFLVQAGGELTRLFDGIARVKSYEYTFDPDDIERRQGYSLHNDIICRRGGDEFAILIRNVTREQLALIEQRVLDRLSVKQAILTSAGEGIPFIASVGGAHVQDVESALYHLSQSDPWKAWQSVYRQTDAGHQETKKAQYDQMWEQILSRTPEELQPALSRPDNRRIARMFLATCCPEFLRNIDTRLQ